MNFSAVAENNRVVLVVGPELAATLSLYLSREGLDEEAERTWAAMEEVCAQMWPAEERGPVCDCPDCPCAVTVDNVHEICPDCCLGRHCDDKTGERRVYGRRFASRRRRE